MLTMRTFYNVSFHILETSITTNTYVDATDLGMPENSYKKSSVDVDPGYDSEVFTSRSRLQCGTTCTLRMYCFLFKFDNDTKECELRIAPIAA